MEFNSFLFLICLGLVLPVYYLLPGKTRKYFLLLCNYLFYSYFDYRLTILLFGLTSLTFLFGNGIRITKSEKLKKYLLVSGILANILALAVFKYYNFFIGSINDLFFFLGVNLNLSTLKLLMPLGISFYIFQTLTFIFDNYYETITKKFSFFDYAVFASFFPTIVAGPIERASRLLFQIGKEVSFSLENLKKGFALITIGMFRKVMIADGCGSIVDHIFAEPSYYKSAEVLITIILYSFQLYNDFAGYSSMARGVAKLFGFNIISNFKQPYFSISITDFWRRWHISLALWLRDYLFKPLQFSLRRMRLWGNIFAIMITFVLCGLWHGPSWNYVFWGFLQGFYMSFSLITLKYREELIKFFKMPSSLVSGSRVLITFSLITISFLFFRAENFTSAMGMLSIIANWQQSELTYKFLNVLIAASVVTIVLDLLEMKYKSQAFLLKLKPSINYGISIALWIVILLYLITADKLPFIYAQF